MCAEHCWGWTRTPSGRALLPDLRETAKAELQSVESIEETERRQLRDVQRSSAVKLFDTLIPPQVPLITPFRSLTESSGTILTSEKGMGATRLFALKQARHSPTAGSTRSGGAVGAVLKEKCSKFFSVLFLMQSNADAKQVESWGSRGRDHVVNVK